MQQFADVRDVYNSRAHLQTVTTADLRNVTSGLQIL